MDNHFIIYELITFFIVSIAIIPIILFSVKVKQPDCIFITLLTYFSVTISSRNGGQAVIPFATNRVISTLVGIGMRIDRLVMESMYYNKDFYRNTSFPQKRKMYFFAWVGEPFHKLWYRYIPKSINGSVTVDRISSGANKAVLGTNRFFLALWRQKSHSLGFGKLQEQGK